MNAECRNLHGEHQRVTACYRQTDLSLDGSTFFSTVACKRTASVCVCVCARKKTFK